MSAREESMVRSIIEYVKDERYRQAVLIDGEWGAGKTFFVKERLLKELEKEIPEKKVYYISLYGLSSSEQIVEEVYSAMIGDFIEEKTDEKKGELIKKGIFFTSKLFAAGIKYFNMDSRDLPKLSELKEIKGAVIVFDDLERCETEINQTLGLLNHMIEHNDIKIILVANQKEIGKMNFSRALEQKYLVVADERMELEEKGNKKKEGAVSFTKEQIVRRAEELFAGDNFYKEVKEKLIGLTVYYHPDLAEVYVRVAGKYTNSDNARRYLLTKKQKTVNLFEEKRHKNIRTLIFGLIAFEKFYTVADAIEFEPHSYIEEELDRVLKYTMLSSIRIKTGQAPYPWSDQSAGSGILYYDRKNNMDRVYGYRFVDDYLLRCDLNEDDIKNTILDKVKERKAIADSDELEKSLNFKKLYLWRWLEDGEINDIIPEIMEELKQQKYSPRYFKDMIVTFMQMGEEGLYDFDYTQIVDLMAKKLTACLDNQESYDLKFLSTDLEWVRKYNETVGPLLKILEEKELERKGVDYSFLCRQECWDSDFANRCEAQYQNFLTENGFFCYIEPEKFISELKKAKNMNIYYFLLGVKKVYHFSNLNGFFRPDIPNIEGILGKINTEEMSRGEKNRKSALECLTNQLQEYLDRIKEPVV